VPTFIIRTIQALYLDSYHHVGFGGAVFQGFFTVGGIRQGCPLSGLLFSLCLDPPMRIFEVSLRNRGIARAFFDDIGMVAHDFRRMRIIIYQAFGLFKGVSGLQSNITKTVVVCLYGILRIP
jgi:hypothetical protein